jgi:hypothetical protein
MANDLILTGCSGRISLGCQEMTRMRKSPLRPDEPTVEWHCHKHIACVQTAKTARNRAGFALADQGQPVSIFWTTH